MGPYHHGSAETSKLLDDTFRSGKIALVNELAMLAERMGIYIWEVVEAASTSLTGSCGLSQVWRGRALRAGRPVLSDLASARV
jgi:3-hydroxyisobutyrate dehydrogenase-like beta-hydroxyacid dehydrogenase